MRKIIREILPQPVLKAAGYLLTRRRAQRLASLPIADAFDEVYRNKMWQQGTSLSGPGSEGKWAEDYCAFVTAYMKDYDCRRVLDMGCGDFLVGQRLAPGTASYIASDISKTIIDINKEKYADHDNVCFRVLNIVEDDLPACDLLLVRQVFQHLTNSQIEGALRNIERARPRRVLVTEHTYHPDLAKCVNLDLASHTVQTRVSFKSGLDIGQPPFSRKRRVAAVFEPGAENKAEPNSVLCIYEMQFPST